MPHTILVAGGTGFIGTRLLPLLRQKGYTVRLLTRTPSGDDQFGWDPAGGVIDERALAGVHAVVNLAGAGVAERRWTPARKKLIVDSRVQSAQVLRTGFQRLGQLPEVYVAPSGIGCYGNSGEQWMTEADPPADQSFLVQCCAAWEQASETIEALGVRTVVLRTGIVLGKEGGALREILKPFAFGVGAYFADGQAWYSWIHQDDMCRMILWALEDAHVEGIYNAVAPNPVRNGDLIEAVAKARNRFALPAPAPTAVLRLLLGEMADAVLFSNRVSAEKVIRAGFHFQFPELEMALADIFRK